ncbi:hypothetical protein OAI90_10125 [Crocinitomicaceae bacterium]|nr:hypothetical protein [Crocinitomicaceae bacterium]
MSRVLILLLIVFCYGTNLFSQKISLNSVNGHFLVSDIESDNINIELIISELVYGTEEVSRTITYPGLGSSFPSKEEANKILKLLNKPSDLRVTVVLKSDGVIINQKTYNHLSFVCFSNEYCGFIKIK